MDETDRLLAALPVETEGDGLQASLCAIDRAVHHQRLRLAGKELWEAMGALERAREAWERSRAQKAA